MNAPSFLQTHRGIVLTALVAALGPIVFLVGEAISAIGWTAGVYDYGVNFISDLGTTVCGSVYGGREMCSPLHPVMNVAFVAMGILIALAVTLIATRLAGARRLVSTILGWSIALGMILVATFHGGVESEANGTISLHVLGAVIAIFVGNTLAIVFGANTARLGFARWYRPVAIIFGVLGLVTGLLIVLDPPFFTPAIFERTAVYSIFAWLFLSAANLLQIARTRRSASTIGSPNDHFVRY
ncbi:MAG: hypothetical protein JWQ43_2242 [Glaciihabitans sp.]|nr:hypothetical protein [Glaciihabitans sp.]